MEVVGASYSQLERMECLQLLDSKEFRAVARKSESFLGADRDWSYERGLQVTVHKTRV